MIITKDNKFIKLNRAETEAIIRFYFDVYAAPFVSQGDGLAAQMMERGYYETRRTELGGFAKTPMVSLIQVTDLWADEFFRVIDHADDYATLFGVEAPEWFANPRKRSKSRDLFRGLPDKDAKHRLRRWLNWAMIEKIAAEKGIALSTLGLYRPRDMVDAQAEHDLWRSTERARSKTQRKNRDQDRAEAEAEIESIPSERKAFRLQETLTENKALKRENAQLKGAANKLPVYRQAVASTRCKLDLHST